MLVVLSRELQWPLLCVAFARPISPLTPSMHYLLSLIAQFATALVCNGVQLSAIVGF